MVRDVTPDEFVAISRYFAEELGMDMFDECSYNPCQLMYWQSTPSDGEYVFEVINGKWLNPDAVLAARPNWRNFSQFPTSSRESSVIQNEKKRQADPLEKAGIIGAFNRVHFPIQDLLDTELSDIYESSLVEGRYDFIAADSSAGVIIYEDRFVYSHHASDPACGKLLNAFDLVRIHRFSDMDVQASTKAMLEYAVKFPNVKLQISNERLKQAETAFDTPDDWRTQLKYQSRSSVLENSVWNLMLILNNDPDFANFAYNEMARRVQVTGAVPWERPSDTAFWRDADTAQLKALIDVRYTSFSSRNHDVCFTKATDDRRFHPIRDYLNNLPEWDGVKRVENLFIRYMQADDTPYTRAVTRKTFAAAIARIYRPGVKFDCVLVLDGNQGIGKSTFFKDLAGEEYYSETLTLTDMNDKSGAEKLQGFWILELSELSGLKKADIEKVKAFLSTSDDKYRPSYGKVVESHPRQCIIIGSVNGERGYLRDVTGNRRFWIIKVHQEEQAKNWNFTPDERNQIWAEAKAIWESGEKLYLENELIQAAEEAQREAMEVDERQGLVEKYLETLLPENWNDTTDIYERRSYFKEPNNITRPIGVAVRETVSNAEIWCECFGKDIADLKGADSYALSALMVKVKGWERTKIRRRIPIYGEQRLYKRK
jgi:predicted P-loop ATPase